MKVSTLQQKERRRKQLEDAYWDTLEETVNILQEVLDDEELCKDLRRLK